MAGKRISISAATKMRELYEEHVRNLQVHAVKKTQYVEFSLPELMEYLNEAAAFSDQLRIYLGVHPDDHKHSGRVTTIIWPYKGEKPAIKPLVEGKDGGGGEGFPPYDEGNGNP